MLAHSSVGPEVGVTDQVWERPHPTFGKAAGGVDAICRYVMVPLNFDVCVCLFECVCVSVCSC